MSYYVCSRGDPVTSPILAVVTPTQTGWRVRTSKRDTQHDYVSREDFDGVMAWLAHDVRRPDVIDREGALECLAQTMASGASFLRLPPEGVERALAHLEHGW